MNKSENPDGNPQGEVPHPEDNMLITGDDTVESIDSLFGLKKTDQTVPPIASPKVITEQIYQAPGQSAQTIIPPTREQEVAALADSTQRPAPIKEPKILLTGVPPKQTPLQSEKKLKVARRKKNEIPSIAPTSPSRIPNVYNDDGHFLGTAIPIIRLNDSEFDGLDRIVADEIRPPIVDTTFSIEGRENAIKNGMPLDRLFKSRSYFCLGVNENNQPVLNTDPTYIVNDGCLELNHSKYTGGEFKTLEVYLDEMILASSTGAQDNKAIPINRRLSFRLSDSARDEYQVEMDTITDFCAQKLIAIKTPINTVLEASDKALVTIEKEARGMSKKELLKRIRAEIIMPNQLSADEVKSKKRSTPDFYESVERILALAKDEKRYELMFHPGKRTEIVDRKRVYDENGQLRVHYTIRHEDVLLSYFAYELVNTVKVRRPNHELSKEYHMVASEEIDKILKEKLLEKFQVVEKEIIGQMKRNYEIGNKALTQFRELSLIDSKGKLTRVVNNVVHGNIKERIRNVERLIKGIADRVVMISATQQDAQGEYLETEDPVKITRKLYGYDPELRCYYVPKKSQEKLKHLYENAATEVVDEFYQKYPEFARMFKAYRQLLIDDLNYHVERCKRVAKHLIPRKGLVGFEDNEQPRLEKIFEILPGQDGVDCFNEDVGTPYHGSLLICEGYTPNANLNLMKPSQTIIRQLPLPHSYRAPQTQSRASTQPQATRRVTYQQPPQTVQRTVYRQPPKAERKDTSEMGRFMAAAKQQTRK